VKRDYRTLTPAPNSRPFSPGIAGRAGGLWTRGRPVEERNIAPLRILPQIEPEHLLVGLGLRCHEERNNAVALLGAVTLFSLNVP
jgi:hypothetical protein